MDCFHKLYEKNFIPIDITGLHSYFNRFYERNMKHIPPQKVLYRLTHPSQEYFVYLCTFLTASRITYIYNHHNKIFNTAKDKLFLSICLPLAIATVINKIGCISLRKLKHVIPCLPDTKELKIMKQNICDSQIERWNHYFTTLHDLDILPAGFITKNFEGSFWYLLTAVKNEDDNIAAVNENSVCIISDISNWYSDDEELCSIIQRGSYLPLTHDKMKAVTCNYYELNKTQHDFETNILKNYFQYKLKDMYDDQEYLSL